MWLLFFAFILQTVLVSRLVHPLSGRLKKENKNFPCANKAKDYTKDCDIIGCSSHDLPDRRWFEFGWSYRRFCAFYSIHWVFPGRTQQQCAGTKTDCTGMLCLTLTAEALYQLLLKFWNAINFGAREKWILSSRRRRRRGLTPQTSTVNTRSRRKTDSRTNSTRACLIITASEWSSVH